MSSSRAVALLYLLSLASRIVCFTSVINRPSLKCMSRAEQRLYGIGVGIDLGTTHSCVAILQEGGIPRILEIPHNGRTMPSVVSLIRGQDGDQVVVGREAIDMEVENPFGTYRNVKRVIGSGDIAAFNIASVVPNLRVRPVQTKPTTKKNKKKKKFGLMKQIEDAEQNPAQLFLPKASSSDEGDGQSQQRETVSPEVISSHILRHLYQVASDFAGEPVDRAVIGVPAYFHDEQREATIRASALAGVQKVRLLREPEAAALSYGIGRDIVGKGEKNELVLVFDLGGGTYDVSMLVVGGGLSEVVTTSGDPALGGSDFDLRIAEHFCRIIQKHGQKRNFLKIPEVGDAMVRAAEQARIHLSNNRQVHLKLPLDQEGWLSLEHAKDIILPNFDLELTADGEVEGSFILVELTRKKMEIMCKDEFQALLRPIREVAIMAEALLPGDASPSIVESALELEEELEQAMRDGDYLSFGDFYEEQEKMPRETDLDEDDTDPDMVLELQKLDLKESKKQQQRGRKKAREVSKKGRRFRAEKRKVDSQVSDVKVRDGIVGHPISRIVLVGGATRMPAIGRLLAALTGVIPQKTVNPDEAVAVGCAVQAGVLDGKEDLGGLTVLTPMQAAMMRAMAQKEGLLGADGSVPDGSMDEDFDEDFDADFDFEGGEVETIVL